MRSRLALGLLLIVAGFVSAAAIAIPPFLGVKDQIESFPKTRLSEGAVELERREYDIYLDVPSGTGNSGWTLDVLDPEGRPAPLRPAAGSITYDWFGREGSRIGKLRVTRPGRHAVRGTGVPDADVIFAEDLIGGVGRSLGIAFAALALLGSAGVVLIVLGAAKRRPRDPKRWP